MMPGWVYLRFLIWRPSDGDQGHYERVKAGISAADLARVESGADGMVKLIVNDGDLVRVKIDSIIEAEPFEF